MRRGDFPAAFAASDAVLARRDPGGRDDPGLPYHLRWVWDGRPLAGRRVLVRCYHGLGDTLQFCRYLGPLRRVAASVTLEVQAELVELLGGMVDRVHPFDPAHPLPDDEANAEIMELAHALRLAPGPAPYLDVAPRAGWADHAGVCWQAGGWDPGRGIEPALLRPLAEVLPLVSLQRGAGAVAGARALAAVDPLDGSMDLVKMARLVAGLGVVVTVDTMVAHLAGALGRPTVVLLQRAADWRWGCSEGCAWYGSVRLIRQAVQGEWGGVVQDVTALARAGQARPVATQRACASNPASDAWQAAASQS